MPSEKGAGVRRDAGGFDPRGRAATRINACGDVGGVGTTVHDGVPAIVMAIHTFGEYLDFHPPLHALVADGLFDREGQVSCDARRRAG